MEKFDYFIIASQAIRRAQSVSFNFKNSNFKDNSFWKLFINNLPRIDILLHLKSIYIQQQKHVQGLTALHALQNFAEMVWKCEKLIFRLVTK